MLSPRVILAAAVLAIVPASIAQARPDQPSPPSSEKPAKAKLSIGDAAPALSIEKWVRGDSLTSLEKGKVYLIEFWATWCGPCVEAIPHLTELQKQHGAKGLTIVSITKPDKRNTLEKVESFVKGKNEKALMTYTVGWDGAGKTYKSYMDAADQNGIPCAFLVDKEGRIAFIGVGFPAEGMDEAIAQVVAGKWDIAKAKTAFETERANENKLREFYDAVQAGNADRAKNLGTELVEKQFNNDPEILNGMAWTIVDPNNGLVSRDADLALKAASRAAELTGHREAGILDTLAWAYFLKGDHAKAIEWEEKAISLATDNDEMKADLEASLVKFKAAKK